MMGKLSTWLVLVCSIILVGASRPASATPDPSFKLNIPAQDLASALQAFGFAVNRQVLYSRELVAGLRSHAVKGQLTSEAAIRILLKGTGVEAEQTPAGVLLIRPSHARTAVVGPSRPDVEETNTPEPSAGLEEVIVTGTSIESQDPETAASRPVHVVTAQALRSAGVTNLEDYFHTQPDFVLSGQSSYTNAGGASNGNGTTLGGTTLNLRGLGSQYTLVLLNGRRFQAEDPANIDLIPVDAIDRIDVLKSGASAVYGSDAVAGVVNIITKRSALGFSFDAYYGESGQADNQTRRLSASWGTANEKLSVLVVAEFFERAGLIQGQRSLSADPDLSRFNASFNYKVFPYSSLAQITLPDGTGPLVLNQAIFGCGAYSRSAADYVPVNSHLYAAGCDPRLDEDKRSLVNPQRKGTVFASLDYILAPDMAIYADFDFARSLVDSAGNLYGGDAYGDPNSTLNLTVAANNYWNPFGVPITAVTYGFPEAGSLTNNTNTSAWRVNLGLKGALGAVHYDIGGSYYYNYANDVKHNLPLTAGLYAAENRPGAAALNFFCNACNTSAQIAGAFTTTYIQDWEEAALLNAHAFAPVASLPAGAVNVAVGAEYQRDAYIVKGAPALEDDELYDVLAPPVSAGRRYASVYIEGQLPLFGKALTLPALDSLSIDVAARYENIQQVGSRTDPTVSVHWEPLAGSIAVRGSYGTSFRAPSLPSAYAPVVTYGAQPLINPATGQYANYLLYEGGNRSLKPETSTYTGYGIVLTPQRVPGLTVQLDRWIINQKNIVIQTLPQLVLNGIQPGAVYPTASGTVVSSLFMNAAGQEVNGTDLDLDYHRITQNVGSFQARLSGTYLNSFKVNDATGAGYVQYAGRTALASSLPVAGMPKIRSLLSASWLYGALSLTYLLHYTGSYVDPTIPGGVDVGRYVTHDIQLGYDLGKHLRPDSWLAALKLTVGVNDLTYAKVPVFYAGLLGTGTLANGYDTSIVNPAGRFAYAQLHLDIPRR